jgi:hypothetical protein
MTDPKKTTCYNHFAVGDKDVIPNAVYKQLLDAIERGEFDEYKKCKELYSLAEDQVILAELLIEQKKVQ